MICTFIGNRDASKAINPLLKRTIANLIENNNVDMFYIGNHGGFDYIAKEVLEELKKIYPINYYVVLAYIPLKDKGLDYSNSIYLDVLNSTPYKYRIIERNKWMIKKSDFVITYIRHIGNSREFKEFAEKKEKTL